MVARPQQCHWRPAAPEERVLWQPEGALMQGEVARAWQSLCSHQMRTHVIGNSISIKIRPFRQSPRLQRLIHFKLHQELPQLCPKPCETLWMGF